MPAVQTYVKKSLSKPDEIREFPNHSGSMKVLDLGQEVVGYAEFKPGWMWSKDMKPRIGGRLCEVAHNMFVISGRMAIRMDDGTEFEVQQGDAAFVAPGHDAWVVGDKPVIVLDWTGARTYAKPNHH